VLRSYLEDIRLYEAVDRITLDNWEQLLVGHSHEKFVV
jgi:aryl carrier-like protein